MKKLLSLLAFLVVPSLAWSVLVRVSPIPHPQFFDASGRPLAGGHLCTYAGGTTTPLATYTDWTGTTQNGVCLTPGQGGLILDAGGYGRIWLVPGTAYKFVLYDRNGVLQWSEDNILVESAGGGGGGCTPSWFKNNILVGQECGGDFVEGTNVTINPATDDATSGRVHLTLNSVQQYQNNGSAVGAEPVLNLIPGTNVTLNPYVDNPANSRVDVTINAGGNVCGSADSCTTTDTEILYTLHSTTCLPFPFQPDSEFHASFANASICPGFFMTLGSPLNIEASNWYGWTQAPPPGFNTATQIDMSMTWEDACSPGSGSCNVGDSGQYNITGALPPRHGGTGWAPIFTGGGITPGHPQSTSTATIWTGGGSPPGLNLIKGFASIYDTALTSGITMTMKISDVYLTIHEPLAGLSCQASGCNWQPGGSSSLVVENNGTPVGTQPILNLIPGTNVTLTPFVDNADTRSIDVTINSTASGTVTGTGTANTLTKWTGASAIGDSQVIDNGTDPTYSPIGFDVETTGRFSWGIANNASTGTTLNHMACDDGAGKAIICSTTVASNNPLGVATTGVGQAPGTTGNVGICTLGYCSVTFDNASVANHFAQMSATVAGDLHDAGATAPTDGLPFWTITTGNASPGLAVIRQLAPSELNAGGASTQILVNGVNTKQKNNFNATTPAAPANGKNVTFATSASGSTSSISAAIVGNGTATTYLDGTGNYSTPAGTGVTSATIAGTSQQIAVSGTCTITSTGTCTTALTGDALIRTAEAGEGDGVNAIAAGSPTARFGFSDFTTTLTITGASCWTDGGNSTCDIQACHIVTGAESCSSILSGVITGTTTWATGSLSGTPTLPTGYWLKGIFACDGTTKQITAHVLGHL